MNQIEELKTQIKLGKFSSNVEHFGGANLIITDDPNRNFHKGDMVIYTEHASALSWLIQELKKIYESKLNYANKYDFYPFIGELIQTSINSNDDLFQTMLFVVDKIEEEWGE